MFCFCLFLLLLFVVFVVVFPHIAESRSAFTSQPLVPITRAPIDRASLYNSPRTGSKSNFYKQNILSVTQFTRQQVSNWHIPEYFLQFNVLSLAT